MRRSWFSLGRGVGVGGKVRVGAVVAVGDGVGVGFASIPGVPGTPSPTKRSAGRWPSTSTVSAYCASCGSRHAPEQLATETWHAPSSIACVVTDGQAKLG